MFYIFSDVQIISLQSLFSKESFFEYDFFIFLFVSLF